jgi:hypothetical protein
MGLIFYYSTFNLAVVIMRDIFRDVSSEVEDAAGGSCFWESTSARVRSNRF